MTTRLHTLRSQLTGLRQARTNARQLTAWTAVGTAVLWALIGVFLVDFLLQREVAAAQRAILLLIAAAAVAWAWYKYARPLLSIRESEVDMALLVERQQQLDSDLVAAIQFEDDVQGRWGSRQLELAVIDYVGTVGDGIDVFQGFDRSQLKRRAQIFGVTAAVIAVAGLIFPGHLAAFANRLALGSQHYPSATQITSLAVNGRNVLTGSGMQPLSIRCAEGRGVEFLLRVEGSLPQKGLARLSARERFERTDVELTPLTEEQRLLRLQHAQQMVADAQNSADTDLAGPWFEELASLVQTEAPDKWEKLQLDPQALSASDLGTQVQTKLKDIDRLISELTGQWPQAAQSSGAALYVGQLPRLNEAVRYRVTLGDAYTDPADITIIALPAVEATLTPIPPKYAAKTLAAEPTGRQAAVLAGSEVKLSIECTNHKPLKEAWIVIRPASGNQARRYNLTAVDGERQKWTLDSASPLGRVDEELRYEIQVTDEDGLHLETPIKGSIRIRVDKPPIAVAATVHRVVLPGARPSIQYRAGDDFGLHKLALEVEVERQLASGVAPMPVGVSASDTSSGPAPEMKLETTEISLLKSSPLGVDRLPLADKASINLANLQLDSQRGPLQKGDRLKVVLVAQDDRGGPGETFRSEPIIIEISDDLGVLSAVGEADPQAAQRIDEILKRELGIGEAP
jgi:hypothetical protein